jgi:murein DD-endopeptidase MepM/ murein hydrolase activator NlpD
MRVDEIKIRLFIEGVLLPNVSEINVTCNANETASARFTFPAVPGFRGEDLKRARIHIFWSDDFIRRTRDVNDWPILFEGEIVSDLLEKQVSSRSMGFFCSGFSTYWEQCKLYYFNLGSTYNNQSQSLGGIFEPSRAAFFGNEKVEIESGGAIAFQQRIVNVFADNTLTMQGKIIKLFKDVLPVNFFFDRSNKELKLDRRFAAPRDDQIESLFFGLDVLTRLVDNQVATYQGETPMMRVLKDAIARFKYQLVYNCQPILVKGVKEFIQRIQAERDELLRQLDEQFKIHFRLNDSDIQTTSAAQSLTPHLDRHDIDGDSQDPFLRERAEFLFQNLLNDIVEGSTTRMTQDEVELNKQFRFMTQGEQDNRLEEFDAIRQDEAFGFLTSIRDELKRLEADSFVTDKNALDVPPSGDPPNELAQMLLLPDTDYAAVPACNVIFPISQTSFGIQRDYLAEPTRLITTVPALPGSPQAELLLFSPPNIVDAVTPPVVVVPADKVEGFSLPVVPIKITSKYGNRVHPKTGDFKKHNGVDLKAKTGQALFAFDAGTVVRASDAGFAGNMIVIYHGEITSVYMHCSQMLVQKGQKVVSGQLIGRAGATGRVTGPHLHFEIIKDRVKIDPTPYIIAAAVEAGRRAEGTTTGTLELVTSESESIKDAGKSASQDQGNFPDYKYLTPEEQVTGIVSETEHNLDRTLTFFAHGSSPDISAETSRERYLKQVSHTRFLDMKYAKRRFFDVPMPFSPFPVAGFPGLVIDKARSVIGKIQTVTHDIRVGGGSGNASTNVSMDKPRFWNEGDPYYWNDGEGDDFVPSQIGDSPRPVKLPNAAKASFPSYYNANFVDTNTNVDDPAKEPFGGRRWGNRSVDELYRALLGVKAIPYRHASDVSPTIGVERHYNSLIDDPDTAGNRPSHTLVGRYYKLLDSNEELAQNFVRNFNQRHGVSEQELFITFLGLSFSRGAYRGDAFRSAGSERPDYQGVVEVLVQTLAGQSAFRG